MGKIYTLFLDEMATDGSVLACSSCKTHFTTFGALISKVLFLSLQAFQGHTGRAWLFNNVINVVEGPSEERSMTTGVHIVRDIRCTRCQTLEKAYEESQRYKEGKFILERLFLAELQTC